MNEIVEETQAMEATENTAVMSIDDELAKESKTIATALASMPMVSTQNSVFKFPDGQIHQAPLDVIIVGARFSKQLWNKNYADLGPTERNYVVCAAVSGPSMDDRDMVPFPGALRAPSDACLECPENRWEYDPSRGKRMHVGNCKDSVTLAFMAPDMATDDVFLIRTSATGTRESVNAIKTAKGAYGHPIKGLFTLDFVQTPRGMNRLSVKLKGPNPLYKHHAVHRVAAADMLDAEPRWQSEEERGAPVIAPVRNAGPKPSGRKARSAAAKTVPGVDTAKVSLNDDDDDDIPF